MDISLFDLFSIGIGPSSSHTVGPMAAALAFLDELKQKNLLHQCQQIQVELFGSLALTGKGHGTDKALLNGLEGKHPETVIPEQMVPRMEAIIAEGRIILGGTHTIPFDFEKDFLFKYGEFLDKHSNGMRFTVYNEKQEEIAQQIYYSIGGGFICSEEDFGKAARTPADSPYPFTSAKSLVDQCLSNNKTISEIMLANEMCWRSESEVKDGILRIAGVMFSCIKRGCHTEGILPGGLNVKRRAPRLFKRLNQAKGFQSGYENADIMSRLNLYAIAVNEENAAGGRIVTAPTNGAAGIIPAVLAYHQDAHQAAPNESSEQGIIDYMLTAAAIAILYKKNASISGAEVGCQGEVGVAASMAAAGLCAVLGGTVKQIENAAEIAMEHHLGMTCDPIGGLVQIPCIERNAMGANKAVNSARMALMGDGEHFVSLDKVIRTMMKTGHDMHHTYKETSQGGLAVNIPEC